MRVLIPFVALVLATPAGCVGTALATAMEARDAAEDAARLWDRDAQLASVLGIEGNMPIARWAVAFLVDDVDAAKAQDDEKVGDGRATAWAYRYVADDRDEAFVVVVDEKGNVRNAKSDLLRSDDRALGAWRIDSDSALRRAKDANQGIEDGVGREAFGILAMLRAEDGRPVWTVIGGGHDSEGAGGGLVRIDAATGETLESAGTFG